MAEDKVGANKTGVEGVVEEVKAAAKKAVSSFTDDEGLRREAEAQEDKAEALQEASVQEVEVEQAGPQKGGGLLEGEGKPTEPRRQADKQRQAQAAHEAVEEAEQREHREHDRRT